MVNPGHLEKLQENVDDWNTWRHDNSTIAPSLWGADLMGARNLRTEQICEARTLYQAELDPHLERKTRYECPLLFEKPKEKTYR